MTISILPDLLLLCYYGYNNRQHLKMKNKKIFFTSLFFLTFAALFLSSPKKASAKWENCGSVTVNPGLVGQANTITINDTAIYKGEEYKINVDGPRKNQDIDNIKASESGSLTVTANFDYIGEYEIKLEYKNGDNICRGFISIGPGAQCEWDIQPENPIKEKELTISITNVRDVIPNGDFQIKVVKTDGNEDRLQKNRSSVSCTPSVAGPYSFRLYSLVDENNVVCSIPVTVGTEENPGEIGEPSGPGIINLGIYDICQGNNECQKCFNSKETGGEYIYEDGGAWTALGCIPTEPMDLVKWLFPYLLGFGGLAAFGLIVFSGFQLMTSSGDPQKIQGAKETITSAVTGLIFIILSLFLLRLIGVDILGLPGLE